MEQRSGPVRWRVGVATGLVGALVAVLFGFLTSGVQATAGPRGLPLALAVPDGAAGGALAPVADRLREQGGERVAWQVVTPQRAAELLADGEVYGVLELAPGPGGVAITTTTSGAVPPTATQAATQVLSGASAGLSQAVAQQTGAPATVTARTVDPLPSPGAASLPLAAASLLWLAGLGANAVLLLLARRSGARHPVAAALTGVLAVAVLAPAVIWGFAELWGLGVVWTWETVGFLALVAGGFAALQAGVLRLMGVRGLAVLGLLYLTAPAVAGQAPELLDPAYRVLLWSWTPLRFAADGLRSLFFAGGAGPAVATGVWVFAGLAAAGLLALLWPARRRAVEPPAAAHPAPVPVA